MAFIRQELLEEFTAAVPGGLDGSLGGFAHQVFELRENLFLRVQLRGVGRQEHKPGARSPDRRSNGFALVAPEVVKDDDIARLSVGTRTWFT